MTGQVGSRSALLSRTDNAILAALLRHRVLTTEQIANACSIPVRTDLAAAYDREHLRTCQLCCTHWPADGPYGSRRTCDQCGGTLGPYEDTMPPNITTALHHLRDAAA